MTSPRELPAEMTIYTAADTHAVLLTWLDQDAHSKHWPVAAQGVAQVDAAGLQLLVSLSVSLRSRGQQLQLNEASEPLRTACASLGMQSLVSGVAAMEVPA